jgi:methionyl-tRNA formyltransferase
MEPKIIFMGSPDFAVPSLKALIDKYKVVGVVTQPDRPAGRGRKLVHPPIKTLVIEMGIPYIQPEKLSLDDKAKKQIDDWNPDVIVVAAFGQILKKDVLSLAPFGCINVHASLLPRWRGVSPIQAAILNGDHETGVTIMKMDEGIDTGDIISQQGIPITPEDTGGSLFEKLAELGGVHLIETLPAYLNGDLIPFPQPESPTPYAPMLKKSDGELNFSLPATTLARQVRAYNPWPGSFMQWGHKPLKIHKAHAENIRTPKIGQRTIFAGNPAVGTSEGLLVIDEIQPSGKKRISGKDFLLGARDWRKYEG